MPKRIPYILAALTIVCNIALIAIAPDKLSLVIVIAMLIVICTGMILGIIPSISFMGGLQEGLRAIGKISEENSGSLWSILIERKNVFQQKTLDRLFRDYQEKLEIQRRSGQVLSDIDEYMNEDLLALHSWHGVVVQIPGTLTGLGILGTFVGLLFGINEIGFSSVDAAIDSVQTVLNGIHIAFYTSIAGIALSIVFNIVQKVTWNMMTRQLGLFTDEFHKSVIPTVDEQLQYREKKTMQQILDRLDRIPKTPAFSIGSGDITPAGEDILQRNGTILMPQILDGIKNNEFTFVMQPIYDINTRKMIASEAFVRWEHKKLGTISPSVFLPVLEENGYITKLDQHMWESVFRTISSWLNSGIKCLPISVNVSKTDIYAGDVANIFKKLSEKYSVPPRLVNVEIAQNAFFEARTLTNEVSQALRQDGFKVILDGFTGDFVQVRSDGDIIADELKLDLRHFDTKASIAAISQTYELSRKTCWDVSAEGIETMEQVSSLRKSGCTTGQGYYFSKPITIEEFRSQSEG